MQMVLGSDHWLAGKLITPLMTLDVNKFSHSFGKYCEAEERGEKILSMNKFGSEETVFCSADE